MLTIGRWLVPARAPLAPEHAATRSGDLKEYAERYGVAGSLRRLVVPAGSELIGDSLSCLAWPKRYGVRVVAIDEGSGPGRQAWRKRTHSGESRRVLPGTTLAAHDRLLVQGDPDGLNRLEERYGLTLKVINVDEGQPLPANLVFAELLLTPRSSWLDKSLAELRFRDRYRLVVLAVQRGSQRLAGNLAHERLRFGDVLLVRGFPSAIELMRSERNDAVLLSEASEGEPPAPNARRAPAAALIILAMLAAMSLTTLPLVMIVLVAVLALVAAGCISAESAYRSVQWHTVILIAGMLPLATALTETGGVDLAVNAITGLLGGSGAVALLAGVFLLTVLVTQFLTNTTSAVLMAPVALQAAAALGVSPTPLLVVVALGASCTFLNPVASPVTTLVLGPGRYRFSDVPRVGAPLQLLLTAVVLLLVPLVFPL
jgi:di/tricarboxylate transporter